MCCMICWSCSFLACFFAWNFVSGFFPLQLASGKCCVLFRNLAYIASPSCTVSLVTEGRLWTIVAWLQDEVSGFSTAIIHNVCFMWCPSNNILASMLSNFYLIPPVETTWKNRQRIKFSAVWNLKKAPILCMLTGLRGLSIAAYKTTVKSGS